MLKRVKSRVEEAEMMQDVELFMNHRMEVRQLKRRVKMFMNHRMEVRQT